MLTVRKEQIQVLDAHMMRKYEGRVIRKIARSFPERYAQDGEEKTRLFVQASIRKAAVYSITEDNDVETYILLLVERGIDFEQAPEMAECKEILQDTKIPADAKVNLLCRELAPERHATGQN